MSVGAVNKQTGERIPTAGMPAVDSVLSGVSTNPVQNRVVKEALDEKTDTDMVAADFNAGSSYSAGNYCVQDGKLYKFKNNHSGAWSASDVDEVKITGELASLKSGLTNVDITSTFYSELKTGVTVSNQSWVSKCGNHIVGDIVLLSPSAFTSTSTQLLTLAHKPNKNIMSFCAGSDWEWTATTLLNLYISASSANIEVTNDTGASNIDVTRIHLDYYTA